MPRSDFNQRSNDELARLLYQSPSPARKDAPATPPQRAVPAPPAAPQQAPEPLASRRISELGPQNWTLNRQHGELPPLTQGEERALFAALSKGTRANLGREATMPELIQLVQRINDARAFVTTVDRVLRDNESIFLDKGRIVFGGSAQRRSQRQDGPSAA